MSTVDRIVLVIIILILTSMGIYYAVKYENHQCPPERVASEKIHPGHGMLGAVSLDEKYNIITDPNEGFK